MRKIGFIGIGIMGKPMAGNLLKAGFPVKVFDINSDAVDEIVHAGAERGRSPQNVAETSEVIITMLPNSPEVRQVILGDDGVIYGAHKGSIVIDMSSIDPSVSKEVAAELATRGLRMLDAPVSGGEVGAVKGTLAIMVGGDKGDFDECQDIFKAMGSTITHTGAIGSGNVTKLANQIIVALNIAAVSEALVLAAKAGVSPEVVYNAIRGGLAGSAALDAKAPLMLQRKFDPGFRIRLHIKDLLNVMSAGNTVGAPLPLTSMALEIMKALREQGCGDLDHSAVVRFYENLAGIELSQDR